MGFSLALEKEDQYGYLSDLLEKYQSLFYESSEYESVPFSDAIIIRIGDPESIGYIKFKEILKSIGEKQFQFICETKEFIRGGIAVGSKFDNTPARNNQYVSNGLAKAVKLESKNVDWPVIGTNYDSISEMKKIFNIDDKEESFGLLRGFNKNGEALFFINFVEESAIYSNLIISKINEYNGNPTVRNKYIWLLKYYLHKYGKKEIIPSSLLEFVL